MSPDWDHLTKHELTIHETHSIVTEIRYIDGYRRLGFGLGQILQQLVARNVFPSDEAVDLALIAATVTAADTRISRTIDSQDSWTREIDLYVPVHDPALWSAAAALIARMLRFLTGDHWRLFFRARHRDYEQIVRRPAEIRHPSFDCVCLFSGGLDSFVGAIDLLAAHRTPLFVSHYWDASTSSQPICARRLGAIYGNPSPRHVRARIGFPDKLVEGSAPEKSQRGRSFLFFALATLAASGLHEEPTIFVPENGLISLNIPLDPLRVGAWSTRTTHPFYMTRWGELVRQIGIRASFENPYRFMTKGEMSTGCSNKALLQRYLSETISCSSVTKGRWKGLSQGHCEYCVPCLIRRAAIKRAFGTDSTDYPGMPNLTDHSLDPGSAEGEHVRSFQMMARRLRRQPALASILVHKSGPLSDILKQKSRIMQTFSEEASMKFDCLFRIVLCGHHEREASKGVRFSLPYRPLSRSAGYDCEVCEGPNCHACSDYNSQGMASQLSLDPQSDYVTPAVGLHPELVGERYQECELLETYIMESNFVGEIGLDGSSQHRTSWKQQVDVFQRALRCSQRLGGRVISIHSRKAAQPCR